MRYLIPLFLLAACGGDDSDGHTGDHGTMTGTMVEAITFSDLRDNYLLPTCGASSCHGSGSGGVTLDPADPDAVYGNLVNATGASGNTLVVPGDADASYMYLKLGNAPGISGAPMPVSGALSDSDPDLYASIEAWINEGAADN